MNMKLYVITNGYQGSGLVKVYVVAQNEERAIELARVKFKEETEQPGSPYDQSYHVDLEVEWRCDNLKEEWVSEIKDY